MAPPMSSEVMDASNVEPMGSTPPPPPPPPPAPLSVATNTSSPPMHSKTPTPGPSTATATTATAMDGLNQESDFSPEELTLFVERLLDQLNGKFDNVSHQLFGKMDEMSTRIEELEKSISGLMQSVDEDPKSATSTTK